MQELKSSKKRIVGLKQTVKAVKNDNVIKVYIAIDSDSHVKNTIEEACKDRELEIVYVNTMKELGNACGIEVGASTAAILKC